MSEQMRWIFLFVALPVFAESSIEIQKASVARQRASLRRQTAASPCGKVPVLELSRIIDSAAQTHHVSPEVITEVARQESAFYPCAVSSKGAQGLMQLMPQTQVSLGVANPFDPAESLMAGARLLKDLLARYKGDL